MQLLNRSIFEGVNFSGERGRVCAVHLNFTGRCTAQSKRYLVLQTSKMAAAERKSTASAATPAPVEVGIPTMPSTWVIPTALTKRYGERNMQLLHAWWTDVGVGMLPARTRWFTWQGFNCITLSISIQLTLVLGAPKRNGTAMSWKSQFQHSCHGDLGLVFSCVCSGAT